MPSTSRLLSGVGLVVALACSASLAGGGIPEDVNMDGCVDLADAAQVQGAFGPCGGCPEDIDGDGVVDITDVIDVLNAQGDGSCTYGACCLNDECVELGGGFSLPYTETACVANAGDFLGEGSICPNVGCADYVPAFSLGGLVLLAAGLGAAGGVLARRRVPA